VTDLSRIKEDESNFKVYGTNAVSICASLTAPNENTPIETITPAGGAGKAKANMRKSER